MVKSAPLSAAPCVRRCRAGFSEARRVGPSTVVRSGIPRRWLVPTLGTAGASRIVPLGSGLVGADAEAGASVRKILEIPGL